MAGPIPSHARVVIIGGGIVGCSVAYHLTKLGWRDVLVLERRQLSCGTTWHAAGLVGQLRSSHNLTHLASYGAVLYEQLEAETGQATGFRRSGSISVARTAERMIELKRGASMAKCFGVDVELISPREAGRLWPLMRTDDLAGAVWIPRDGRTNPIDTTLALAKGARQGGATIVENVTVTAIHRERGAATGVSTDSGDVACEVVVNCAGLWGRDVGRMAGVNVPLHASEHFYSVTEPLDGVTRDLPVLRDTEATSTCARRSADCSWAASSRWPNHGAWTACRRISPSRCCPRTGSTSVCSWSRRSCAFPRWRRRPSGAT